MRLLRTVRLTVLFAILVAVFGTVGYYFMGSTGLVLGLGLAGAMNIASYWYSDRIVLRMHRAQPLDPDQHADIHGTVAELARTADIPVPDLYVMESETPNAFATGRSPSNGVVCVTTGLLRHLDSQEVEGVLAHEIGHIANRDTLIQAVAGTLAGAVSMLAQLLWFSSLSGENRHPAFMLGGMLLAPFAASLVKAAISRSREYTADATAAQYTDASYLASALQRIEAAASQRPMQSGARGTSHMFIVNPFRGDTLSRLFSTHPPTEERVQRLRQL